MQIEIDTVKGFRDYLPPESIKRKVIVGTVEKIFTRYGFVPIETPVLEFDELMRPELLPGEIEDEAIADRFRLRDKGGRNLGLRYEFTFQLARILKQNPNMKLPFRRYQIGNIFRDEPIRLGRTRQFTQCDIDVIGDPSQNAEAECISAVSEVFKSLGIQDFEIKINNRKLISAIIESTEITESKQVMRELDKIGKIGEDEVKSNLKKYASSNQIITLFKLMEKSIEFFKDNAFEGASEVDSLISLCRKYGVKPIFSPSLVRGLAYYTGNIFEIVIPGKNSIAGGGRYDKSVGKYLNKEIPAVGISFSLEALMGICEEAINKIQAESVPKVLILSINKDNQAIKFAQSLRKEDVSTIIFSGSIAKNLEYANSLKIPYVIFIGEDEVKKGKLKLRDMLSGKESLLSEKQIISKLIK